MRTPRFSHSLASIQRAETTGRRPLGYTDFCLSHAFYDHTTGLVLFTLDAWVTINEWVKSQKLNRRRPISEEEIECRRRVCSLCGWNINGICEHPGCLPCKQRANGGLKWKTSQPQETCPDRKWPR